MKTLTKFVLTLALMLGATLAYTPSAHAWIQVPFETRVGQYPTKADADFHAWQLNSRKYPALTVLQLATASYAHAHFIRVRDTIVSNFYVRQSGAGYSVWAKGTSYFFPSSDTRWSCVQQYC